MKSNIIIALLAFVVVFSIKYYFTSHKTTDSSKAKTEQVAENFVNNTNTQQVNNNSVSSVDDNDNSFAVNRFKFVDSSNNNTVILNVDYPQNCNSALGIAVCEYIANTIGSVGKFNGNISKGSDVIKFYGKDAKSELNRTQREEGFSGAVIVHELIKSFESRKYVTYIRKSEGYTPMAAHGWTINEGITFCKADGRKLTTEDIIINTESNGFKMLLKEGVRQYFEKRDERSITDEDLQDMLMDVDINSLPKPEAKPCLMPEGIYFQYQEYEICPFSEGTPDFTIPYDNIKPYLKEL